MKSLKMTLMASAVLTAGLTASQAMATDLEVTHWWTSGGEAAAVKVLADEYNATGNNWVDGAIAGGGGQAVPVITSRIAGGDPMGATQLNHGLQAQELVEAGMMQDLTDVAEEGDWANIINPPSLLESCTFEGKVYCAPLNIHSWQWLWVSKKAFDDAGVEVPTNWDEFTAAAPQLIEAGKIPLAMGQEAWQQAGAFNVLMSSLMGEEVYNKVYKDLDVETAQGAEVGKAFTAAVQMREMQADSNVQAWNEATTMVINGDAGGQIMGDWAQGEFQVAGQVAGEDYFCLPGLGVNPLIATGGDAFYFPANDDENITMAQKDMAKMLLTPETQVDFNLKKGSLPVRSDVDLDAANDCMKKGLDILKEGKTIQPIEQLVTPDTNQLINDLFVQFFSEDMSAEDAQARFAEIIGDAS